MGTRKQLSRRSFLGSAVALATVWELQKAAWALGLSAQAPVCALATEQEVGPYYVADELLRADIREGKPGVPLTLRLAVMDARTCRPMPHAAIDIWHCDALGLYAGFTKMDPRGMGPGGPGGPRGLGGPPPGFDPQHPDPQHPGNRPGPPEGFGPPPAMKPTDHATFLRGIQFTNEQGRVEFATVFPGFYMGRTNHIHFKVREGGHVVARGADAKGRTYAEGHTSHVGQVFFPEDLNAELMRHEPYARHQIHRTTNTEDMVFQDQHGGTMVAKLQPVKLPGAEAGYVAELIVAVDPTKTPEPVGMRPGGPGGPHGRLPGSTSPGV